MSTVTVLAPNNRITTTLPRGGYSFGALWALYTLTLRQYLHGKKWMVMAALMLLPTGLAILVRYVGHDVPGVALEFIFGFMFIPQALLPLIALIYATGMIQDEQEEQTITYLLIRPIAKWALYTTKLLATLTTTGLIAVLVTILTYAAIYVGADSHGQNILLRCLTACWIHTLAIVAYCCLFGLLGLITKRMLIAGILYIVIVEGVFANLAFGIRLITVIYYTRLIAYRFLEFQLQLPDGRQNFSAEAWQLDINADPQLLKHPQLSTCFLVLIVGSLICTALAAYRCSQREFHVKTPEKG